MDGGLSNNHRRALNPFSHITKASSVGLVIPWALTASASAFAMSDCERLRYRTDRNLLGANEVEQLTDDSSYWHDLAKSVQGLDIQALNPKNAGWNTFRNLLMRRVMLEERLQRDWKRFVVMHYVPIWHQNNPDSQQSARRLVDMGWWPNYEALPLDSPDKQLLQKSLGPENQFILDRRLASRRVCDATFERLRAVVIKDLQRVKQIAAISAASTSSEKEILLDWLLYGEASLRQEPIFATGELERHDHATGFAPSNPAWVQDLVTKLNLTTDDTVVDIGSGLGRVVLLGALLSGAKFVGVEFVAARADYSEKRRKELKLNNATFAAGDAMNPGHRHLLEEATVFYLFNPLSASDQDRFIKAILALPPHPQNRPRRVVTFYMKPYFPRSFRHILGQGPMDVFEIFPDS